MRMRTERRTMNFRNCDNMNCRDQHHKQYCEKINFKKASKLFLSSFLFVRPSVACCVRVRYCMRNVRSAFSPFEL